MSSIVTDTVNVCRFLTIHFGLILSGLLTLAFPTSAEVGRTHCDQAAASYEDRAHLTGAQEVVDVDLVIYGGTSAGVAAAVQAKRLGLEVILLEPGTHLGGLTSGGLGATDIGNKAAIGGISREFYQRVKRHYQNDENWTYEAAEAYRNNQINNNEDAIWMFEPSVAESIMHDFIREEQIGVVYRQQLDRENGVAISSRSIESIRMLSGEVYRGKMFIDATYEGDLMAAAGVSYHVGREANETYDETLNGVQTLNATKHQFAGNVDPYRIPGDPSSGLLPGIDQTGPGEEGAGDHRVQAYCFRMCTTDQAENRRPWIRPANYDPLDYELLLRNFEAGADRAPWNPILMPNRKTDTNNNRGFSTDYIGASYDWAEADYQTREAIFAEHLRYQQGLMWTLANSERVPESIRREFQTWGNCLDEFSEYDGWSHQLYVREARRMISSYVMTQHNCQGRLSCEDPVALAAYTMDSHNVQRYVNEDGYVRNEGDVQVGGFSPYPIAYRSIVPKQEECDNLLVPVCLSASHIAYGSIRMEPVFMVLGQSAATAAELAISGELPIQEISYEALRTQLLEDDQILEWTGPVQRPVRMVDLRELEGVAVDDLNAEKSVGWVTSRSIGGFAGAHYLHDDNAAKGSRWIRFTVTAPFDGEFDLRLGYTASGNRASNVPVTIIIGNASETQIVDQRIPPPIEDSFLSLGEYSLRAGTSVTVELTNRDTDGHVIADSIWLAPIDD